jgi:hypothetical protein
MLFYEAIRQGRIERVDMVCVETHLFKILGQHNRGIPDRQTQVHGIWVLFQTQRVPAHDVNFISFSCLGVQRDMMFNVPHSVHWRAYDPTGGPMSAVRTRTSPA